MNLNRTNKAILQQLKANGRMSWQQIGKAVHLTGQAVAARVQQLEEQGLINGYTIRQKHVERHFVTMFMERLDFDGFEAFLIAEPRIEQAYKITGEGCYQFEFISNEKGDLDTFLNTLLRYGTYKVSSAIRCVK
ncbi:Lrp/AsnC family transcriptional regulator [Hydromonas duriensis]|uniref:AsnC family transcriptional regulator n=1 Tax=Hydromonas duriensis TaxID=1527608 RepID=A0A4R6Y6R7_9BURK|nr:AsnC family transcriptional regulator [Hydromonas duriensis]TDR30967.1 AsnC family transcriptional regulator [Hydromonas duriensis]